MTSSAVRVDLPHPSVGTHFGGIASIPPDDATDDDEDENDKDADDVAGGIATAVVVVVLLDDIADRVANTIFSIVSGGGSTSSVNKDILSNLAGTTGWVEGTILAVVGITVVDSLPADPMPAHETTTGAFSLATTAGCSSGVLSTDCTVRRNMLPMNFLTIDI